MSVWSVDNISLGPLVTTHLVLPRYTDTLAIYDEYGNPLPLNITAINSTHLGVDVILPWIPAKYYLSYGGTPYVDSAYSLIRYSAMLNGSTPIYIDGLGGRDSVLPWFYNYLKLISTSNSFYLIQRHTGGTYAPTVTSGMWLNFTNVRDFTGLMFYIFFYGYVEGGCQNPTILFYLNDSLTHSIVFSGVCAAPQPPRSAHAYSPFPIPPNT
ncbi:MAG: hypothetical protein QXM12_07100, partial [Nitrososphaerota archaeon]